ncbi:MAG: acetyl-CoA C-acetyltransferase [Dehalococcoidia bacterium]
MKLPKEVVIIDYLRSPFSRSRPQEPEKDVFNNVRMDEVAAILVNAIIKRTKIDPKEIDECITGTARPQGETATGGGRFPVLLAKLPLNVAGHGIDSACGSSLTALRTAVMTIGCDFAETIFVLGIENMNREPVRAPSKKFGTQEYDYLDMRTAGNMGLTAEKLYKQTKFSRKDMDEFALRSHQLAMRAQKEGYFKHEIVPVEVTLSDGSKQIIDNDICIRGDTTLESLMHLKPAYKLDGEITAGNSSPRNAGAAAMLVMSRDKAKKLGLKPMASFISFGMEGVDPSIMGIGPVPASRNALEYAGLKVEDIDWWEINEAFSIVPLNAIAELGINSEKVNVKGGAIAIGHPLGASGVRLVGTLARILKLKGGTYGLATMCCGMGQGVATIVKKE